MRREAVGGETVDCKAVGTAKGREETRIRPSIQLTADYADFADGFIRVVRDIRGSCVSAPRAGRRGVGRIRGCSDLI
jgi:hypothetical protein